MSIATEVDALVRRRDGGNGGPQVTGDDLMSESVSYYCSRGRELQAEAMNAALQSVAASIAAYFSSAIGAVHHRLHGGRAKLIPSL